ncbi:hypothetical protein DUNSADRAFT_11801 [Dunaliella salina]|uniref:Phospholipid/glycerol acyltransferase domain-containing protein n=1 Tax=Dunaliella salina TaxID=3046 RepID=A0ABQ7GCJ6_DUNSA|nr:hypothetical protein DUNSADRAFT_11801 [Dunaliella salina]|eukprot:KAF5832325.1 hypothetical protein DUNSADRAFT_11801 [Dunaliella salina]
MDARDVVVALIEKLLSEHGATSSQVAAYHEQRRQQKAAFQQQEQLLQQVASEPGNASPQDTAYKQRLLQERFHQYQLQQPKQKHPQVVLVGESFGGALALRVALAAPHLLHSMVLVNPATSFNRSLGGMTAFVSSTNLLGLFPQGMYNVAQSTLLPLLVNSQRLVPQGADLMRAMIEMTALPSEQDLLNSDKAAANGAIASGSTQQQQQQQQPSNGVPPPLQDVAANDFLVSSEAAAAANFRSNLMREADLPDDMLRGISVPVLLISAARDRLLPSVQEGTLANPAGSVPQPIASSQAQPTAADLPESNGNGNGTIGAQQPSLQPQLAGASSSTASISPSNGGSSSSAYNGGSGMGMDAAAGAATAAAPASSAARESGEPARRLPPPPNPRPSSGLADNAAFDEWIQILAPWRDLVSPVVLGTEHLPPLGSEEFKRPMLFVGNHQRVGLYDTPLLVYEMAVRGYRVRGLAHPGHWSGPLGSFFEIFGAVKASPMAAFRLLRNQEKVLLFPGGAKEVTKPRGSEYMLQWKSEPDFVRLAAKCDALIVPFACVGADDAFELVMDNSDVMKNPVLGPFFKGVMNALDPSLDPVESMMPLTRLPGLGLPSPIPVPNMNRLYFKFSPPIDTAAMKKDLRNDVVMQQLYNQSRQTVEQCMADLLAHRQQDKGMSLGGRLISTVDQWVPLIQRTATTRKSTGSEARGQQREDQRR